MDLNPIDTAEDAADAAALLEEMEATLCRRRGAEVRELELLAAWAARHAAPPTARERALGERLVRLGGEGTPLVRDLAMAEAAIARQTGLVATERALADVLDLQYRLPRVWARVQGLACEVWLARQVARKTRQLTLEQAALVDAAVAPALGALASSRVLGLVEAKVVEADPEGFAARQEAELARRYVSVGRSDEAGLRHVVARVEAGDAAWIDATVDRVADLLAARATATEVEQRSRDEWRAEAFGWLARPAELLQLLLEHQTGDPTAPETSRATAFPEDLREDLRTRDLTMLRPKAVLYLHLHQAAIDGTSTSTGASAPINAVVRVEGIGPMLPRALPRLLAGAGRVVVKPVLDLADRISLTAYEHPEALKERIHLVTGGDYYPWAASTSRRLDHDHPTPYDPLGPPGQTGTHNAGPLSRRHHRIKTHHGFTSRQVGPGRYVWRTRLGAYLLVDHHGTRPITPEQGQRMFAAHDGMELYTADLLLTAS